MNIRPWDKLQEALPLLSSGQKRELRESLESHGQQYPILHLPDGRIIDGVHRQAILKELGRTPDYKQLSPMNDEKALALGIALRLARGQMTVEQHREVVEWLAKRKPEQREVAKVLREQGKTQKETAEIVGVDQSTISDWEKTEVSTNMVSHIGTQNPPAESQKPDKRKKTKKEQDEEIVQRAKAGESQRQIAADFGLSQKAVAKKVKGADKPKKVKSHKVEDDISKIRSLIEKLRVNWTSERDKAVARQFLKQTANGI